MSTPNQAAVLLEALPYLQRYRGETVVVKFGGHAMVDEALEAAFAQDVTLLQLVGLRVIVVHGGGPQIGALLQRLGLPSRFVEGHRVTDDETMDVVEMVLAGQVNKGIVSLLARAGAKAVGLSGKDGGLLRAHRILLERPSSGGGPPEIIDPGRVGEIEAVDPTILGCLDDAGFVPVVAPVGSEADGKSLNINADLVAGAIASAVQARRLLLLTDVVGVKDAEGQLIAQLNPASTEKLIADGTIHGGMIPKLRCCLDALAGGVRGATILDGRVPHALLLELLTSEGVGTVLRNE